MVSTPHPLAAALIERLQSSPTSQVLDFGAGAGRNTTALRAAGFTVVALDDTTAASNAPFQDVAGPFDAAISTHGLLHGTAAIVGSNLEAIADRLNSQGLLFATFGSTRDARFGLGERLGDSTFAPADGDERGVPHTYFDRGGISALVERYFGLDSLEERGVDEVAGTWAHARSPLHGAVHWFAIAHKK